MARPCFCLPREEQEGFHHVVLQQPIGQPVGRRCPERGASARGARALLEGGAAQDEQPWAAVGSGRGRIDIRCLLRRQGPRVQHLRKATEPGMVNTGGDFSQIQGFSPNIPIIHKIQISGFGAKVQPPAVLTTLARNEGVAAESSFASAVTRQHRVELAVPGLGVLYAELIFRRYQTGQTAAKLYYEPRVNSMTV